MTRYVGVKPLVRGHRVRAPITKEQDAQLSQRDRAAGCVMILAKSGRLELGDNILRTLRTFNHSDIIGLKINRIRWKKRKIRAIIAFRSFEVIEVSTNRKPVCDVLLVT